MARHYYLTRSGRLRRKDNTLAFESAATAPEEELEDAGETFSDTGDGLGADFLGDLEYDAPDASDDGGKQLADILDGETDAPVRVKDRRTIPVEDVDAIWSGRLRPGSGRRDAADASTVFQTFFAAYGADGSYRFANSIGEVGVQNRILDAARTASNDVVVSGYFQGNVDFDFSPAGTRVLSSANANSSAPDGAGFVAQYDGVSGAIAFASGFLNGPLRPTGTPLPRSLSVRPDGKIAIAGNFGNQLDADPGSGQVFLSQPNEGAFFIFLNPDGSLFRGTVADEAGPDDAVALSVGPNPARSGVARVRFEASGPTRVSVVDVLGREAAVLFDGIASAGQTVAVPRLAPGTYVVRSVTNGQVQSARFTVVR